MARVIPSGWVMSTKGGSLSAAIRLRRSTCIPKVVQAEFTSKQGASIPSSAATVAASAGVVWEGMLLPEMTSPMSPGVSPARSRAIRAAAAAIWQFR